MSVLLAAGSAAQAQTPPRPGAPAAAGSMPDEPARAARLSLAQVLQAAGDNFDVAAARANLSAARADVLAADHAPLPVLSGKIGQIDLQNGSGPGNWLTEKRIDKSVGLDWTWERGGKRARRVAVAEAAVGAAQADVQDMRLQQQILALNAYYDVLAAQQRHAQVAEMLASAQAMAAAMNRRLKAGDLSAQDAARAEIEATKARLDLEAADLDRARAALALAQLLGRSNERVLVDDAAWADIVTPAPAAADEARPDAVMAQALARRPDVLAADQRVLAARAALDGAQALRQSDVTWGVSVDHFPGTSTRQVELRLQMPLQIGYRQEGEIGRARAQLQLAEELAARTRSLAQADLNRLWQEARAAAAVQRAHELDLLPRARQVLAQAELAYSKGALSLTDLLEARRVLRASLLDAIAARSALAKAQGAWQLRAAT